MEKAIIIGAGTYGEVYLAYLKEVEVQIVAFLDDNISMWGKRVHNIPVLGGIQLLESLKNTMSVEAVYCPIGNNKVRTDFLLKARELGYRTPNFIHKSVLISPSVDIASEGVYILPNTTIMPYVTVSEFVMISVGVNVIHHTHLSRGVFISNGVNLGANVNVQENVYVGMGATIMTGVENIGKNSLIGAGAVVTKNVIENTIVAGVPAKMIKYNE